MRYIKVFWDHNIITEPVVLYSEIDDLNWEVRKVEIYTDGRKGYADKFVSSGGTRLGIEPLPELEAISSQAEFRLIEIKKPEFEEIWSSALVDS